MCSQLHDSTTHDLLSEDLIGRISSPFYKLIGPELDGSFRHYFPSFAEDFKR
jgi:hypothetical protein